MGKRNYLPVPISIPRQLYSWWNTCNANSAFFPDISQKNEYAVGLFLKFVQYLPSLTNILLRQMSV